MTRALLVSFAGLLLFAACGKSEPLTTRCTPGLARCDSECADLRKDRDNCGACGTTCVAGQVCSNGACTLSCQDGLADCDGECSSLRKDPENCGACGVSCKEGEVCSSGACVSTCGAGQVSCNGACTNIVVDPSNCGGCGKQCAAGAVCSKGVCVGQCPPELASCGASCTDLGKDSENCGACGNVCGPGLKCSMGKCAVSCQPGLVECSGLCTNLQSDVDHCGACGKSCGAGETCDAGKCVVTCQPGLKLCNGVCSNTKTDLANCGTCGNACPGGKICANGVCANPCGGNQTFCGIACTNTQTDEANCGGCGIACGPGQICNGGTCGGNVCAPNTTQSCYSGPPGTQGVGACKAGTRTCNSSGTAWSTCVGQVLPSPELCADMIDNDCNGITAVRVFSEAFANNAAGWTLGNEWAIGPTAASMCAVNGTGEDPAADHTPTLDNGVAGVSLAGCYAVMPMHPPECLVSPSINAANLPGPLTLSYWRHLHTDYPPFVESRAQLSANGGMTWTTLWEAPNTSTVVNDPAWTQQTFDVTGQKSSTMRLRFCFATNGNGVWSGGGWSVDDVLVTAGESCQ